MTTFGETLSMAINYIKTIGITDILDILIVAVILYQLFMLVSRTNSARIARGIAVLLVVLWLSGVLHLNMINYLLRKAVEIGLIALVVLFQPELRRLLERMGSSRRLLSLIHI